MLLFWAEDNTLQAQWVKTDTEKLTVEMEGNLADYMMDFVLIVEGIKEEVLREDLRHMKEIANIAFDTENPEETAEKIEEYFSRLKLDTPL